MAQQTPSLSQDTKNRIVEAVTNVTNGNQIIGSLGLYGGASINASADTVAYSTGDVSLALDSGGAPCTYRVFFPQVNSEIQSIDWIDVKGFTPRVPSGVEVLWRRSPDRATPRRNVATIYAGTHPGAWWHIRGDIYYKMANTRLAVSENICQYCTQKADIKKMLSA